MINEIRLAWEPKNLVPLDLLEEELSSHFSGKNGGVSILNNGTLLFINVGSDPVEEAKRALEEAKFILDFKVAPIGDKGYLVALHGAVAVYVGKQEFQKQREALKERIIELKFPSEESLVPNSWSEDEYLIGLLGRAKLQKDAYEFDFHKRLEFS